MDFYRNFGRKSPMRSIRSSEVEMDETCSRRQTTAHLNKKTSLYASSFGTNMPKHPPPISRSIVNDTAPVPEARSAFGRDSIHDRERTLPSRPFTSYPSVQRPPPFPRNFHGVYMPSAMNDIRKEVDRPQTSAAFSSFSVIPEFGRSTKDVTSSKPDVLKIPDQQRNCLKGTVRVSRLDAWTRFLSYEACFQVCLQGLMDGVRQADVFMNDGCCMLKQLLQISDMLLPSGTTADDSQFPTAPYILWDESSARPSRTTLLEQGLGNSPCSSRMPSPPRKRSPSPRTFRRPRHKIRLDKLTLRQQKMSLQRPLELSNQRKMPMPTSIYVSNTATGQYFYTFVDDKGYEASCTRGGEVILESIEGNGLITVEVYANENFIGSGSIKLENIDVDTEHVHETNHRLTRSTAKKGSGGGCFAFLKTEKPKKDMQTGSVIDDEEIVRSSAVGAEPNQWNSIKFSGRQTQQASQNHPHGLHQPHNRNYSPVHDITHPYENQNSPRRLWTKEVEIQNEDNVPIGVTCCLLVETLSNDTVDKIEEKTPGTQLETFFSRELDGEEKENEQQSLNSYIRVNGNMAFEYLLGCALRHDSCGSNKLRLEDPWDWLVDQFVNFFGINPGFKHLTHIKWILRPEVRSCTTPCLEILLEKYSLLRQERDTLGLEEDELATMRVASREIKELLATVFENYYCLSDLSESGIHDCMSRPDNAEYPPPALHPALELLGQLGENDELKNQTWLVERFRIAATRKYHRLQASCNEESYLDPKQKCDMQSLSVMEKKKLFKKMEQLASALQVELEKDHKIQETGLFPDFLNLPALSASVFSTAFLKKLEELFLTSPPHELTDEVVDMLLGVGKLQGCLRASGSEETLFQSDRPFDVFAVFEPFVSDWLYSVEKTLQSRREQLGESLPSPLHSQYMETGTCRHKVFPLVSEMIILIESEVDRFERLIRFWNEIGIQLECVICLVLRDLVCFVSEQSGMKLVTNPIYSPVKEGLDGYTSAGFASSPYYKKPPSRFQTPNRKCVWQWKDTRPPLQHFRPLGIEYQEAVLLNSLRYLLGVVPDFETKLRTWSSVAQASNITPRVKHDDQDMSGPEIGAQFAQVVKELRTEYSHATVHCCERMAEEITRQPQHMMGNILYETPPPLSKHMQRQWQDTSYNVDERMTPLFETLSRLSEDLEKAVDLRVLVTLLRGLWEHLSEDLYIFVESLHEGHDCQEAWRSRQNAKSVANCLNEWFRATLTQSIGHELTARDLDLPLHASMTQKLLADNSSSLNVSYTVF